MTARRTFINGIVFCFVSQPIVTAKASSVMNRSNFRCRFIIVGSAAIAEKVMDGVQVVSILAVLKLLGAQ